MFFHPVYEKTPLDLKRDRIVQFRMCPTKDMLVFIAEHHLTGNQGVFSLEGVEETIPSSFMEEKWRTSQAKL
jgi:hypothetical protein